MDDAHLKVSLSLQTTQGTKLIHDVLYVLYLACTMLSGTQMMSNGYSLFCKSKHFFILDSEDSLTVKVEMVDKYFPLEGSFDSANFKRKDELWLWHR